MPPGTLVAWDQEYDIGPEEGVRKFITADVVKVELVFTTGPPFTLAEPYVVVAGTRGR
jgi:hypothetical protein